MTYKKTPTEEEIDEQWKKFYKEGENDVPAVIQKIENEELKFRLFEAWKFIQVHFRDELQSENGLQVKNARAALYNYITKNYFKELGDVKGIITWFGKSGLLDTFEKEVPEEFIKTRKEMKQQVNE